MASEHPIIKARCRSCDANIVFITIPKGDGTSRRMPCDAEVVEAQDGKEPTLVMNDGRVIRKAQDGTTGRIPHWATCPDADRYRR